MRQVDGGKMKLYDKSHREEREKKTLGNQVKKEMLRGQPTGCGCQCDATKAVRCKVEKAHPITRGGLALGRVNTGVLCGLTD